MASGMLMRDLMHMYTLLITRRDTPYYLENHMSRLYHEYSLGQPAEDLDVKHTVSKGESRV